jgi:hypothetical protein
MANARGQAKPKRQPKQPNKYERAKHGRQTGTGHSLGPVQANTARDATIKLKATHKQAT